MPIKCYQKPELIEIAKSVYFSVTGEMSCWVIVHESEADNWAATGKNTLYFERS